MPTEPRQVPVSQQPDAARRRLHIHGIKEMPAGYDAEVAELFRDLRAATTLTEMDLAARLGTRADVVQALEHGALFALPPWPETCRVVNNYGALLNLDVRPLLRRIYAQLEAGIVELQPKAMPDVPVMTPPETGDFGFAPGNTAGAPAHNPLDIPWPPPPSAPPPQTARPNVRPAPAPQAPWPNPAPSPQPQPQNQNAWPNAQAQPQAWPGGQPMPQAPRPGAAPQRPAAPQQQAPDRRAAPPRPQQAQAPQPQPQPQPMPPRQAPQPQPQAQAQPTAADFRAEPVQPLTEPDKKRRRPALLKWGIGALIVSVVAFGLWFALSQAPIPSGIPGLGGSQSGTLDPDDPRSRKSDRLPSPPGG
ncbi:MAG TPA: hypothetical protein VGA46_05695 [Methyloceanibacter sp.]|jgi:hypothetical protein